MSLKRGFSPTLSMSDDDDDDDDELMQRELRRRIMTVAEARSLPESELFKLLNKDIPRDVSLFIMEYVSTLGLLESAGASKSFVTQMTYTNEFWERRWIIDFQDQAAEIGSEIPTWCRNDTGDGIELYPEGDKRPAWDRGYIPWKKYWIWTWFFRRSLMRIFAEIFTQTARRTMASTSRLIPQDLYTFKLKPRSSNEVVASRPRSDGVFVLKPSQLLILSQNYGQSNFWGAAALKTNLQAVVSVPGIRVSLPLAAAFMCNNILPQGPDRGFIRLPLGLNRTTATGYAIALQMDNLNGSRIDRDALVETYLNWYVYKVLNNNRPLRPEEDPATARRGDSPLVRLIKQRMPGIIQRYYSIYDLLGQDGNPSVEWEEELSTILNAPRVAGFIAFGDDDANKGKIFLGTKLCSNCDTKATKRCKGCKAEYYCGKECQTNHWVDHKYECVGNGFRNPYPKPTITFSNWTYKEWAEKLVKIMGSKEAAISKAQEKDTSTEELKQFWWWVIHEIKSMCN